MYISVGGYLCMNLMYTYGIFLLAITCPKNYFIEMQGAFSRKLDLRDMIAADSSNFGYTGIIYLR